MRWTFITRRRSFCENRKGDTQTRRDRVCDRTRVATDLGRSATTTEFFCLLSDKWSRESVLLESSFSLTGQSFVDALQQRSLN